MAEKVLVTGGAGFMGSALVRILAQENYEVFSYDNYVTGTASNLKNVISQDRMIRGDIESSKFMSTISQLRPDVVFHLAADPYIPLSYDHPERFVRTNFEGTMNVLMTCKTFGVRRIIHYSTSEVYGSAQVIPMDEQHVTTPQSVYALSKLAADNLCQVLSREQEVPVVITRPFNCYGPRETHPYVIPEIMSQLARSNELILGNLQAERDFTYVDDTARAAFMLMDKQGIEGQVFNIGSEKSHSVKELANQISLIMKGMPAKIQVDPSKLRPYDVSRLICNSSKVRNLTGWRPKVELEDGLRKTVEWYKTNDCVWEWERRLRS